MRKSSRADPGVQAFFGAAKEEGHRLYLSVVTVGEQRRGVDLIRHRGDCVALQPDRRHAQRGSLRRHGSTGFEPISDAGCMTSG